MAAKIKLSDLKKNASKKKTRAKKGTKKAVVKARYTPPEEVKVVAPPKTSAMKAQEIKWDNAARLLVEYNFNETKAYKESHKSTQAQAENNASEFFKQPDVIRLVKRAAFGDVDPEEMEKQGRDWAINIWQEWVNITPLDFFDDDGKVLPIKTIKRLPILYRRALKDIKVSRRTTPVSFQGEPVMDENGAQLEVVQEDVTIVLVNKEKAMEDIAKCMKWIQNHTTNLDMKVSFEFVREGMAKADSRAAAAMLSKEAIDGEFEEVEDD